jgi:hypothetical protein
MPEMEFYASPEDEIRIVEFILGMGLRLVPHICWPTDRYDELTTMAEYENARELTRQFSAVGEYPEVRLETYWLDARRGRGYFIRQRNGGPTMDFLSPLINPAANAGVLVAGSISYYPTYWNAEADEMLTPPDSLKRKYRLVCAEIRRHGRAVRVGKLGRRYWLCADALDQLASNQAMLESSYEII